MKISTQSRVVFKALGTIVIVVFIFVFGVFVGTNRNQTNTPPNTVVVDGQTVDLSSFWHVWNLIDQNYPTASTIDAQTRVYGAIQGLVGSLGDPYSEFFNPEESKEFSDTINGSFGGVGIELGLNNQILTVIAPLKGTPAANAGIKAGDEILKINGQSTENITIDQAVQLMRGDKGTSVTVTILHAGSQQTEDITLIRDIIEVPEIETKELPGGIYYIAINTFSSDITDLFQNAITSFKASGDTKLIIDLRDNPGGYLDSAVDIASYFLPAGTPVVIEDYGPTKPQTIDRSYGYSVFKTIPKTVLLVDGGSASASEILAGALNERADIPLVGTQTYGKGSVQELFSVTDNTSAKITIARWLTPNGISISKQGLTPTYVVPFPVGDSSSTVDPQLNKAIELLNNE